MSRSSCNFGDLPLLHRVSGASLRLIQIPIDAPELLPGFAHARRTREPRNDGSPPPSVGEQVNKLVSTINLKERDSNAEDGPPVSVSAVTRA